MALSVGKVGYIVWVVVALTCSAAAFYWFAFRPVIVRQACYEEVKSFYASTRYERCLHKYGY